MRIKAQGLLNAARYIEETYGQAALRDVIRACSEPVRERYTSAIAIEWHSHLEFVEILDVAERQLGTGDGHVAEEIGAFGARANLKGTTLRLVFYLAKPEFLMRRITALWNQYNDEGSMELVHFENLGATIEVKGMRDPRWLFCCTLTGWSRELVIATGGVNPNVKHVECRAKGDARCLWQLKWTKVVDEKGERPSEGAIPSKKK